MNELPKISEFLSKLQSLGVIQITTNYPVTPRFRELTRSPLDRCGVSHVETTSKFPKICCLAYVLVFQMHDFYIKEFFAIKMGSSCLNPVSWHTSLTNSFLSCPNGHGFGMYHNLQQSSTTRMITWFTRWWLIHENLLRSKAAKSVEQK